MAGWSLAAVLALGVAGCREDTRSPAAMTAPVEFARTLQRMHFGCADFYRPPPKATDTPGLVGSGTCHLQQTLAVPSKKELAKAAGAGRLTKANANPVAGPVAVFVYRNRAGAEGGIQHYIKTTCSSTVAPPDVTYFAGPNWFALSLDTDPDVMTALGSMFGDGIVHATC
ncbi:MAG: hypothetical protein ACXV8T_03110 [Acidimicrobiia bacterium]